MTKNAADRLTAIEAVKRSEQPWPNRIIECLTQTNELLLDMPAIECNKGTSHTFVRRTSKVRAKTRSYYEGTPITATQTDTVTEHTGMWQDISKVDADLADHTGDPSGLRKTEAIAKINGIGEGQAVDMIYGKRDTDKENGINGFATRLAKINGKTCITMGGTGSNLSSVYLAALGDRFTHLIYPKGFGAAGVHHEDKGKLMVQDQNGHDYEAYTDVFKCQFGIAVEDPRSVVRLANINFALISADDFIAKILYCLRRLPVGASTYVLYGNLDARDKIDEYARNKGNVVWSTEDPWGRPMQMIQKLRIRTVEAILSTEDQVA
jgi:hypothetical protein